MDFFASQDAARRQTKWLVVYFVVSVIAMIAVLYIVACFAFYGAEVQARQGESLPPIGTNQLWQPGILLLVALGTVAIIGSGSLYKTFELWGGGEQVALQFGGRRLQPNSSDPAERRLLNVVEEMALASGISVPPVYVLDNEQGINAFAAGFTPNDAVIGVNRGTLDHLSRDELQGVMAHEFSHILNGDMRLNLRLIGLLHGILLISIIGYFVLRMSVGFGGGRQQSRGGGKKGGGAIPILIMGVAMWLIGSMGLLCARLIKSAISRQREYLADASAVQFTRNPDGIAGALKKIGGIVEGSRVNHPEAESASHMFFGPASRMSFGSLLATHPPLVPRIRRIDPDFDGKFPRIESVERSRLEATAQKAKESRARPADAFGALGQVWRLNPALALEAVGTVQPGMIEYATLLMASLPDPVQQAIHDPFSARLVVMTWLLDSDPEIRQRQLEIIREREGDPTVADIKGLAATVASCPDEARLPMLEVLQGSLVAMSAEQYAHFRETVVELVRADHKVVLGEFILKRILLTHLDRHYARAPTPTVKYMALSAVVDAIADLLSIMVVAGSRDPQQQMDAYRIGMATLALNVVPNLRPKRDCTLERLDAALNKVELASPTIKKRVLAALLSAAAHDETITVREAELLRAVAVAIDCPLPPLLPGPTKPLATPRPSDR